MEPGDQNPNPPFREPSDEDDAAAAGRRRRARPLQSPLDGSQSFLDEMEKGFREMMGDAKGAPPGLREARRPHGRRAKGDGERK